jgi:hypothetical protein
LQFSLIQDLEDIAAAEFNKIFSGRQPLQVVKVLTPPTKRRALHSIPCPGQMEIHTPQSRAPIYRFWFYQAVSSTLKMGSSSVPETMENFRILIRLCAQEDFIEFWIIFGKFWDQISVCRRVMLAFNCGIFQSYIRKCWGTRWHSWLRRCATSRKVVGSIPDGFIGIFH